MILAIDLFGSSACEVHTVDPSFGLTTLLHIHHATSQDFFWYTLVYVYIYIHIGEVYDSP